MFNIVISFELFLVKCNLNCRLKMSKRYVWDQSCRECGFKETSQINHIKCGRNGHILQLDMKVQWKFEELVHLRLSSLTCSSTNPILFSTNSTVWVKVFSLLFMDANCVNTFSSPLLFSSIWGPLFSFSSSFLLTLLSKASLLLNSCAKFFNGAGFPLSSTFNQP